MPKWSLITKLMIEKLREIKINSDWSQFDKVIQRVDSVGTQQKLQLMNYREAEHQLSRFENFENIANELKKNGSSGDVIEFGTWQGLGITLLAKALGSSIPRKFVGIDAFEGLPDTSTGWQKGQFSNTSADLCKQNILRHLNHVHKLELIECWFDDPDLQNKIQEASENVNIIHFDCDLGLSLTTALPLIEHLLVGNNQVYLVFDDWGCYPDEIPDAFFLWEYKFSERTGIKMKKFSSSKLTRTYVVDCE